MKKKRFVDFVIWRSLKNIFYYNQRFLYTFQISFMTIFYCYTLDQDLWTSIIQKNYNIVKTMIMQIEKNKS